MANFVESVMFWFVFVSLPFGLTHSFIDAPCGDWIPFKNEKCVMLITTVALQTKQDAEIICKSINEEFPADGTSNLVTVNTEEKQQFLTKMLFKDLSTVDNVWLGLELDEDGMFRWNDGSDLFFTNWAEDGARESKVERERNCVQMESGEGTLATGKWARVTCEKRNAVVCERNQPWTLGALQNTVLSLKLELEMNRLEFLKKITDADQKLLDANQKINDANGKLTQASQRISKLENNLVPLGFVYVQLPGQDSPTTVWPNVTWNYVSEEYSGLFFRVQGGEAAPFGQEQQDNTRNLQQIGNAITNENHLINPPVDGSWSLYLWTGGDTGKMIAIHARMRTGKVRPRNKSMKVWKRIK